LTLCREIQRNTGQRDYRPIQAHQHALAGRGSVAKNVRFTDELEQEVTKRLELDWSPEQISGWLKNNDKPSVIHETIYQFIIADQANGGQLYKHLRQGHKRRRKRIKKNGRRGQIPHCVSIVLCDLVVQSKQRVGVWEMDTVIGKNHKSALVTAVERKTKFNCTQHVPIKEAALIAKALIDMLSPFKELVHTITADNSKEFAEYEKIAAALNAKFYSAHPYSSWERGFNENTNGLIRQYFPKKTSLAHLDKNLVRTVQNKLNNRPRKTIDFNTPFQVFFNFLVALGT